MTKAHTLIRFDNSQDLGAWYDDKYTEMGGGWKIPPEEALRLVAWAGIEKDKTRKLLDIGCGDGDFIGHIADYAQCIGIDLSAVGIKLAGTMPQDAVFTVGDIENAPYLQETFDYLTSIGSIEHCVHIEKALKECYRILKPAGKFLALVPNELWLHMDQPQEQTHTDGEWATLFEAAGFAVVKLNRRNDLTDFLLKKKV